MAFRMAASAARGLLYSLASNGCCGTCAADGISLEPRRLSLERRGPDSRSHRGVIKMLSIQYLPRPVAYLGICCSLIVLTSQTPAPAQDEFARTHSMCGWIPTSLLLRPVPLRTGIGTIHEEVSTSSKRAQEFYDQGLAYLQSYVWIEAARSFHQALREDPRLVMAYVGLSYAYSPIDFAAAKADLDQAQRMAGAVTDREQRRIHIRALQLEAMADTTRVERELAFRDALADALVTYPDDVVFLLLRGTAAEPSPFADGQGCDMR